MLMFCIVLYEFMIYDLYDDEDSLNQARRSLQRVRGEQGLSKRLSWGRESGTSRNEHGQMPAVPLASRARCQVGVVTVMPRSHGPATRVPTMGP